MKDSSQVVPGECNFERIAISFLDISHIEFDMSVTPKYHELNS